MPDRPSSIRGVQNGQAAFAHRPVDHAGMAEPAAPGTAPGNLHGQPVVDGLGKGHHLPGRERGRVEVGHNGLVHPVLARDQAVGTAVRARGEIFRDVDARHGGQTGQQFPARTSIGLARGHGLHDRDQRLLAVAQDHGVEKRGHGFGIEGAAAAGDDQGRVLAPLGGPKRQSGQIEQIKDIGVAQLMGEVKRQHVAVRKRRVGLQRTQRRALLAQHGGHLVGGREDAFGGQAGNAVDGLIQDASAHIGHPHLVEIGKYQGHPGPDVGRVLGDAAPFGAPVLGGFVQPTNKLAHTGLRPTGWKTALGGWFESGNTPPEPSGDRRRTARENGNYFFNRLEMLPLPARSDKVLRSPAVDRVRLLVASR